MKNHALALLLIATLSACASGGKEEDPQAGRGGHANRQQPAGTILGTGAWEVDRLYELPNFGGGGGPTTQIVPEVDFELHLLDFEVFSIHNDGQTVEATPEEMQRALGLLNSTLDYYVDECDEHCVYWAVGFTDEFGVLTDIELFLAADETGALVGELVNHEDDAGTVRETSWHIELIRR